MVRTALLFVAALSALVASGGTAQPERAAPAERAPSPPGFPPFRGLPVKATVVPARGGVGTVFRVRIDAREPIGVRAKIRRGYEAHLFNHATASGCIVDTGGFVNSNGQATTIVLDPSRTKGSAWCPGTFRGALHYYQGYACPDRGTCDVPPDFPRRSKRVARLAFSVR
jgi:hypothetical protein